MKEVDQNWDLTIRPKRSLLDVDLKALWHYRDLLMLFVRRDIVSVYQQTILGPIWFFLQPILTTITFIVIFGNIAKLSTDGVPSVLFYLSGLVLWNYFAACLTSTSDTFTANAAIFGKVYFPRLIIPLSLVVSNLLKMGIQVFLFIVVWLYFLFQDESVVRVNAVVLLFPFLLILMAGYGLSFGIIISSLTTKYRDLKFLVQFGVQLLMYASPVVYPLSMVPEKYKWILLLNPMTSIIETFKYGFLGSGMYNIVWLLYNFIGMFFFLNVGVLIFNKVEKTFMDTV
ncbi:MAG TPA: ABC transporter permease [Bacteroidia bacterium]|nr:ABC transporter permease [Bacteroidia bacterium]